MRFNHLVATGLLLCALAVPTLAQNLPLGVVDEDKLAEGYKAYRDAVQKVDASAQELDRRLTSRELLNDTEVKRFDELIVKDKDTLTAAEEGELTNLVKTGADRRAEYIRLVGTATRTAEQNARIKELESTSQKNAPSLQRMQDTLFSAVKKQQDAIDKQYTDHANQVIEQIAGEKQLVLVVRKRAVVWNSDKIDITAAVLERLNKA